MKEGNLNLNWVIIGGGIHGVHIAARLIGDLNILPDRLRIIDPGSRLLDRWRTCTETTGMTYLRSPSVHHIDLSPWSLKRFAGKRKKRKKASLPPLIVGLLLSSSINIVIKSLRLLISIHYMFKREQLSVQ